MMKQMISLMSYEDETDDTDDEAGLQKEDIPQQVAQLFWFNFAPLSLCKCGFDICDILCVLKVQCCASVQLLRSVRMKPTL